MLKNTFKTNTTDATLTDIFSKTDMYLGGVLNEEELLQFIAISAGARLAVIKDQKRQKQIEFLLFYVYMLRFKEDQMKTIINLILILAYSGCATSTAYAVNYQEKEVGDFNKIHHNLA